MIFQQPYHVVQNKSCVSSLCGMICTLSGDHAVLGVYMNYRLYDRAESP